MSSIKDRFVSIGKWLQTHRLIINHLQFHAGGGAGGPTIDEMPVFTGGPSVWTMPQTYVESSIDCEIGTVRLVPGTDFTTSGTTFTFDGTHWPSGPDGQRFVVWRARRA